MSTPDQDQWRLTRAMKVCEGAGPLSCGLRQCMVGKPCALADEIHDAMLEAEQRAEPRGRGLSRNQPCRICGKRFDGATGWFGLVVDGDEYLACSQEHWNQMCAKSAVMSEYRVPVTA